MVAASSAKARVESVSVLLPALQLIWPPKFSTASAKSAAERVRVPLSIHSANMELIPAVAAHSVRQPACIDKLVYTIGIRRSTRITKRRPLDNCTCTGAGKPCSADSSFTGGFVPSGSTLTSTKRSVPKYSLQTRATSAGVTRCKASAHSTSACKLRERCQQIAVNEACPCTVANVRIRCALI